MAGFSSDYIPAFSTMLLDKHKNSNFWYENKCPRCGNDDVSEKNINETVYIICEKCGYMEKAEKKEGILNRKNKKPHKEKDA